MPPHALRADPIRTLLLAAGAGRRFGADKLCALLPDATPLVVASARNLLAAGCSVIAVVRDQSAGAGALLADLDGIELVGCPDADAGLGHSLAAGVAASLSADGWLVALGDMPAIQPSSIARVLAALRAGGDLVAPAWRGQRGHPVGFGRCWRDALLAMRGDRGARDLLAAQAAALHLIPVDDPGVVRDVDRPADLAAV